MDIRRSPTPKNVRLTAEYTKLLGTLQPDALAKITKHPSVSDNQSVCPANFDVLLFKAFLIDQGTYGPVKTRIGVNRCDACKEKDANCLISSNFWDQTGLGKAHQKWIWPPRCSQCLWDRCSFCTLDPEFQDRTYQEKYVAEYKKRKRNGTHDSSDARPEGQRQRQIGDIIPSRASQYERVLAESRLNSFASREPVLETDLEDERRLSLGRTLAFTGSRVENSTRVDEAHPIEVHIHMVIDNHHYSPGDVIPDSRLLPAKTFEVLIDADREYYLAKGWEEGRAQARWIQSFIHNCRNANLKSKLHFLLNVVVCMPISLLVTWLSTVLGSSSE